jgi:hypothetical protein
MGKIVAIDFNNTLEDSKNAPSGKRFGPPLPGAVDALYALTQESVKVVIFTLLAANPSGRQAVADWLEYFDIDYDEITAVKPNADLFVDDRGLHHQDWTSTMKEVNRRLGLDI